MKRLLPIALLLIAGCDTQGETNKNAVNEAEIRSIPAPFVNQVITGDRIFQGVNYSVNATGNFVLFVNASYTAHTPNSGDGRNIQGSLSIAVNGTPCAWANEGNQAHEWTLADSASCTLYFSGGPANVSVKANLTGGNFDSKNGSVQITAFSTYSSPKQE